MYVLRLVKQEKTAFYELHAAIIYFLKNDLYSKLMKTLSACQCCKRVRIVSKNFISVLLLVIQEG